MKKTLAICLLLLAASTTFAQKKKNKAIEPAIDIACDCMEEADKSGPNVERAMETCIVRAFTSEADAFMDHYDLTFSDFENMQKMEEVGVDFGLLLMSECTAFMEMAIGMAADDDSFADEILSASNFVGSLTRVEKDDFIYVSMMGDDGMSTTFVLNEYVIGASEILAEKKVRYSVDYELVEIYSPKSGEFESKKVIRYIEVLD